MSREGRAIPPRDSERPGVAARRGDVRERSPSRAGQYRRHRAINPAVLVVTAMAIVACRRDDPRAGSVNIAAKYGYPEAVLGCYVVEEAIGLCNAALDDSAGVVLVPSWQLRPTQFSIPVYLIDG